MNRRRRIGSRLFVACSCAMLLLLAAPTPAQDRTEAEDGVDYNGDGDKADVLWIDNGTNKALNNDGF